MTTLTVVIPSYNRYDSLKRTLQKLYEISSRSHLVKTRLIILDNCSEDNRYRTLESQPWLRKFSDFSVLRHKRNYGIYRNIREAFRHCRGDWLWVLSDDDDILFESLDFLAAHAGFDLVVLRADVKGFPLNQDLLELRNTREVLATLPSYSVIGFISIVLYSGNLVSQMHVPELEHDDELEWTLFPHVRMLFEVMANNDHVRAIVRADIQYVKWAPNQNSYKSQHHDAIAGMYALFPLISKYRGEFEQNFIDNWSYTHFLKPAIRDPRLIKLSYRAFGLVGTANMFKQGLETLIGKVYEKLRSYSNLS